MQLKIGNRLVGDGQPCFIIAEAGVNHNGDMKLAKKLVDEAVKAGVDAIKFQTFKAENIVTLYAKQAKYQTKNTKKEESQYDMLKKLELGYGDFRELKEYCDNRGIIFMSTPHSSKEDVDLVAELCPVIKIGSGDLTNLPFLRYIAERKLPVILSTGMSTMDEVREAVNTISTINKDLIILHATTNYPTPPNEVNLKAMDSLRKEFGFLVGYSDHTTQTDVPVVAVAMGACVIEKHFTLDKSLPGPDHEASFEPNEFKELVDSIRNVEHNRERNSEKIMKDPSIILALGDGVKKPMPSELAAAEVVRKSIVAAAAIRKGTVVTESLLAIKRPGTGLKPKYYSDVIGKTAKRDISKDEFVMFEDLE